MTILVLSSLLVLFGTVVATASYPEAGNAQPALAHTHAEFTFSVDAPYERVFPLFGAYEERKWALGFDPQFVYPSTPHDRQGMVFTTAQDGMPRVWVNTVFDAATGHTQYVYFIADTMVALIDVQVTRVGTDSVRVSVVYERTALKLEANEQIIRMARTDANSGARWAEMMRRFLGQTGSQ